MNTHWLVFGVALLLLSPAFIEDWQSFNLDTVTIALLIRFGRIGVWGVPEGLQFGFSRLSNPMKSLNRYIPSVIAIYLGFA